MASQEQTMAIIKQLVATNWRNTSNTTDRSDYLALRHDGATVISLTRNIGACGDDEPTWLSEPMLPYYFDPNCFRTAVQSLLEGCAKPALIPFTQYAGIGDNIAARGNVEGEFLQLVLLSSAKSLDELSGLEIQWCNHGRIQYRFRSVS